MPSAKDYWHNGDVEVQHRLPAPELLIEGDGRIIAIIGLDVDDPRVALGCDRADVLDQRGSNALPPVFLRDGEVVDVEFAPRLLEFFQLIGDEAAYDLIVCRCCERAMRP